MFIIIYLNKCEVTIVTPGHIVTIVTPGHIVTIVTPGHILVELMKSQSLTMIGYVMSATIAASPEEILMAS